jgi:hypothetical protein
MHREYKEWFRAIVENNINSLNALEKEAGETPAQLPVFERILIKLTKNAELTFEEYKMLSVGVVAAEMSLIVQIDNLQAIVGNMNSILKPQLKLIVDQEDKFPWPTQQFNKSLLDRINRENKINNLNPTDKDDQRNVLNLELKT